MLVFAEVRAIEMGFTGHVLGAVPPAEKWLLSEVTARND